MEDSTFSCCAYCWKHEPSWNNVLCYICDVCKKKVHYNCIKSHHPSCLFDDTFFTFKCEACSEEKKEEFTRSSLSWQNVVMLSLYNLHKSGQGKCGHFHWKSHICAFIDKHWLTFFGHHRKKSGLWMGTVAGTLSTGCPELFKSGANVVEQGYWRLTTLEPPIPGQEVKYRKKRSNAQEKNQTPQEPLQRRCRKAKATSLTAAIELKAKRSSTMEAKEMKKQQQQKEKASVSGHQAPSKRRGTKHAQKTKGSEQSEIKQVASSSGNDHITHLQELAVASSASDDQNSVASELSQSSVSLSTSLSTSKGSSSTPVAVNDVLNTEILKSLETEEDDCDLDIGIDSLEVMSDMIGDMRAPSPDFHSLLAAEIGTPLLETTESGKFTGKFPACRDSVVEVKLEPHSDMESEGQSESDIREDLEEDDRNDDEDDDGEKKEEESEDEENYGEHEGGEELHLKEEINEDSLHGDEFNALRKRTKGRPRKRRRLDDEQPPSPPPKLKRISVFEENDLLDKLNAFAEKQSLKPELAQLRRKLICNQTNREYGLPVFDLEAQMVKLGQQHSSKTVDQKSSSSFFPKFSSKASQAKETRDLDRFMMTEHKKKLESRQCTTFHQRLVGLRDHELQPVQSPYTTSESNCKSSRGRDKQSNSNKIVSKEPQSREGLAHILESTPSPDDATSGSTVSSPSALPVLKGVGASDEKRTTKIEVSKRKDRTASLKKLEKPKRPCPYCGVFQTNLSRHVTRKHKDKQEVKHALRLKGKNRLTAFDKIRKLGIYYRNLQLKADGTNSLERERRYVSGELSMCVTCKGFYKKTTIKRHKVFCCPGLPLSSVRLPQMKKTSVSRTVTDFKTNVLSRFGNDEIGNICKTDTALILLGRQLWAQSLKKQRRLIMSQMRNIAKLILHMSSICEEEITCEDITNREYFDVLEQAARELGTLDNGSVKPGLKLDFRNLINRLLNVLKDEYLMHQQSSKVNEVAHLQAFLKLCSSQSAATRRRNLSAVKRKCTPVSPNTSCSLTAKEKAKGARKGVIQASPLPAGIQECCPPVRKRWTSAETDLVKCYFASYIQDTSSSGLKGSLPAKPQITAFLKENLCEWDAPMEKKVYLVKTKIFNERNKFRRGLEKNV